MSETGILDRLLHAYDQESVRNIIKALRWDPLVWDTINSTVNLDEYLPFAGNEVRKWKPGLIAAFFLDPNHQLPDDLLNAKNDFPSEILLQANQCFDTFSNTGIILEDLKQVGLITLALIIDEHGENNWQSIVDKIFLKASTLSSQTFFTLWRSVFACLPSFTSEYRDLFTSLITNTPIKLVEQVIGLTIHGLLTQPNDSTGQLNEMQMTFGHLELEHQLSALRFLKQKNLESLYQPLAVSFLNAKSNLDQTSNSMVDVERSDKGKSGINFYRAIDHLEKAAELYHFAGMTIKSCEIRDLVINKQKEQISNLYLTQISDYLSFDTGQAQKAFEQAQIINSGLERLSERIDQVIRVKNSGESQEKIDYDWIIEGPEILEVNQNNQVKGTYEGFVKKKLFQLENDNITLAKKLVILSDISSYLQRQDRKDELLEIVEKLLNQYPNDPTLQTESIKFLTELGQWEKATRLAEFRKLLEPTNKENTVELVDLYEKTGNWVKAFDLQRNIVSSTDPPSHTQLIKYARISIEIGKPDIAISICKNLLEGNQLDGEALIVLGNAYIASKQVNSAIEHMERATSLAPQSPEGWIALANIWEKLDDYPHELDTLLKAKSAIPDNFSILKALGTAYFHNDLYTNAIPHLKEALFIKPEDIDCLKNLANSYFEAGYIEEAWNTISSVLAAEKMDIETSLIAGKIAYAKGDIPTAFKHLNLAYMINQTEKFLLPYGQLLIFISDANLDFENAKIRNEISELEQKTNLLLESNESFSIKLLNADLKLANGDHQAAYDLFLSLAGLPSSKSPANYQHLQFGIGKAALALQNYEVSLAALHEALLNNPKNYMIHQTLAKAFLKTGSLDESLECANSALQVAPENISNILWFADFMKEVEAPRHSVMTLKNAIIRFPSEKALYLSLAKNLVVLGEEDEARKVIDQLMSKSAPSPSDMQKAASILLEMQDNKAAVSILRDAAYTANPLSFQITYDLCFSLLRLGDAEGALSSADAFTQKNGLDDRIDILKTDIYIFSMQFEKALQQLSPLLEKARSNLALIFTGDELTEKGRFDLPYSLEGILLRQIELLIMTGDLNQALKLCEESVLSGFDSVSFRYHHLLLLFCMMKHDEFIKVYTKHLNSFSDISREYYSQLQWMRMEIALSNFDISTIAGYLPHIEENHLGSIAIQSLNTRLNCLDVDSELAASTFSEVKKKVNHQKQSIDQNPFSFMDHMVDLWDHYSFAKTAWHFRKFDLANESFNLAESLINTNPIVNYDHAEFLLSLVQHKRMNESLKVITHSTALDVNSADFSSYLDGLVANVSKIIDHQKAFDLVVKQKAVKENAWPQDLNITDHIKNAKDVQILLPLLKDPNHIENIIDNYSDNFDIRLIGAVCLYRMDPQLCTNQLPELFNLDPTFPPLHFLQAMCNEKDDFLSTHSLETAVQCWPDEPEWHVSLADKYLQNKQFQQASDHLEKAIALIPDNAEFWQKLGNLKTSERDFQAAKSYFSRAIDLFPDNPVALCSLAKINRNLGMFDCAIECMEKAIQFAPGRIEYQNYLADLYFEKGDYQKSELLSKSLISGSQSDTRSKISYLKSLLAQGKLDQSNTLIQQFKRQDPESIELRIVESQLVKQTSGCTEAIKQISELANENPENTEVLSSYAGLLLDCEYLEESEKVMQQCLAVDPELPGIYLSLGRLYRKQGNLDLALSTFSKAIAKDPGLIDAHIELGKTYQDRKEHQQASKVYAQGLLIFPESAKLHYLSGMAFKECKDYKNAEIMLRKAAQIEPGDALIRRQLAGVVALNLVHNLQEPRK